ncbi:hypothetical protein BaRGS_00003235 [Batillaria attramentaria]|uniref:Uncharacterized protein n=1 Tax=Batillaria attramentaria TaxID=370345 RepID=A0ABD0M0P7_9CAEN
MPELVRSVVSAIIKVPTLSRKQVYDKETTRPSQPIPPVHRLTRESMRWRETEMERAGDGQPAESPETDAACFQLEPELLKLLSAIPEACPGN